MTEHQHITLAVVGSRDAMDYAFFEAKLKKKIQQLTAYGFVVDRIISGEAPGIDAMVVDFCAWNQYNYRGLPADWTVHGKSAGFIRNAEVVSEADIVVAFWDRKSHGTKDTIDRTLAAKKLLQMYTLPEFPIDGRPYYPQTRKLLKAATAA